MAAESIVCLDCVAYHVPRSHFAAFIWFSGPKREILFPLVGLCTKIVCLVSHARLSPDQFAVVVKNVGSRFGA